MARLRDLGFTIGTFATGASNAITDVAGVSVGHRTVVGETPRVARTGVTIVNSRPADQRHLLCYGGIHAFNGNGELTGSHWLEESGLLSGPIGITNTHQVGLVRDTLVAAEVERDPDATWCLPVVGETYDGFLNDIDAFHLTAADVRAAIDDAERTAAQSSPVAEGNVGGGTGMVCHEFKGGIGTSSRLVEFDHGTFTVGALVQANYGARAQLRLDGLPVGTIIDEQAVPMPSDPTVADSGSIIVIIATDAPVLADQCKRLARRATVGLSRVGGTGGNGSGDLFIAFSTHNKVPLAASAPIEVTTMPAAAMTPLFNATADAVEESIWNALCAAETMTGHLGRTVHAIPHERLIALRQA